MSDSLTPARTVADAGAADRALLAPLSSPVVGGDFDVSMPASLPGDHPAWPRDVLSVSARVRAIVATLRPVIVRVLSFWDHGCHEIAIGAARFGIDASGCYRLR